MEYFTSVENTPYYQWQSELLIESFKHHNLDDKLLLSLAKSNTLIQPLFFDNISKHQNIYGHENIGDKRGFKPLNYIYSLIWCITSKRIKQPFACIQPSTLLQNPLNIKFSDLPEIIFYPDPFFTYSNCIETVGDIDCWFQKEKGFYENKWTPLKDTFIFNNLPEEFFPRLISITEILCVRQLQEKNTISNKTIQIALAINIADHFGRIALLGDYSLENTMLGDGTAKFINYEHGLPPVFNKSMFKYDPPNYTALGDPFEILAENYPTPSSFYVSELAKKNLKKRPKK